MKIFQRFFLLATLLAPFASFAQETCEICGCSTCPTGFRAANPDGALPIPQDLVNDTGGITELPCGLLETLGLTGQIPAEVCNDDLRLLPEFRDVCGCPPIPPVVIPTTAPVDPPTTAAPVDPPPSNAPVPAPTTSAPVPAPQAIPTKAPVLPPTKAPVMPPPPVLPPVTQSAEATQHTVFMRLELVTATTLTTAARNSFGHICSDYLLDALGNYHPSAVACRIERVQALGGHRRLHAKPKPSAALDLVVTIEVVSVRTIGTGRIVRELNDGKFLAALKHQNTVFQTISSIYVTK